MNASYGSAGGSGAALPARRVLYLEHNTDGTVGGSHYCLLEICRTLDRDAYVPVVCFFEDNPLIPAFKTCGAEVVMVPPPRPVSLSPPGPLVRIKPLMIATKALQAGINLGRTLIGRALFWRHWLREHDIDIVHLNNSTSYDHDLVVAAVSLRIPAVAHERGIQPRLSALTRLFTHRLETVIAISDAVRDNLIRHGIAAEHITRIDDGIDPARYGEPRPASDIRGDWGIPPDAFLVGIVGNIKPWKGQETVVRAIAAARARLPGIHCFLVGATADAEYERRLHELASSLGVSGIVHFTGYQSNPADFMAAMDVVIHASVEPEPFGIVILEAMMRSRPVIATDIGGPREIVVEDETGFRVPPGDPDTLASRIAELAADPERARRMGHAGRKRFLAHYTAATNARALERVYNRLG